MLPICTHVHKTTTKASTLRDGNTPRCEFFSMLHASLCLMYRGNISSTFSRNYKAFAFEFLEYLLCIGIIESAMNKIRG